ncbi:MAG: DMT family protein [Muribaculaceae bacterium]|nr:DMT family protein [Muribaculaceae bacterium]MBQ4006936.1 DMT family protein [Muribaculaceae bacterium]
MSLLSSGVATIGLLIVSNVLMTFAWYGHLKLQNMGISTHWPLIVVILFSWGIAFFEYLFMVPANRIGYIENGGTFSLMQLKVVQEVISLSVFTIFVIVFFKGEALHWNHFVAFGLLVAAVFFAFLESK